MSELIPLPESLKEAIDPYLPTDISHHNANNNCGSEGDEILDDNNRPLPFITLTFAQSLDSRISLGEGTQTKLSHLQTKTMTHYLRYNHDAILIGINTFLTDNPSLNCRYNPENVHPIRPIIIDPNMKSCAANNYNFSNLNQLASKNMGLSPYIIVSMLTYLNLKSDIDQLNNSHSGPTIIPINTTKVKYSNNIELFDWPHLFSLLKNHYHINSIMIEGGAFVINNLLSYNFNLINSLIITIAPVYLGKNAIQVSPDFHLSLLNNHNTNDRNNLTWWTGIQDSVLMFRNK
ncbi:2,5-diamino-6-(ribosylamino)-4(3H)-pyrimidinone 5'-phosphate reductase [Ascoidea rubescens DSM 1968]|uniref:2,5-diamino-6-ribosylamino-4(3H)-pyrimidinone 5'-phosphate reductase n=1 Tax=Ascoidea rubescens DSM 1968 TaxID=1344418 RepID=A0A1D2VRN4_9ASCO|nr:dihydrofolate reductase [Ascoidea rubescens DSM 1968]ODV64273.1 dihydrofolate reductase [Ascoidea rubescens DSM 1968]